MTKFKLFVATYSEDKNQWLLISPIPIFSIHRIGNESGNFLTDQISGTFEDLWQILFDDKGILNKKSWYKLIKNM